MRIFALLALLPLAGCELFGPTAELVGEGVKATCEIVDADEIQAWVDEANTHADPAELMIICPSGAMFVKSD